MSGAHDLFSQVNAFGGIATNIVFSATDRGCIIGGLAKGLTLVEQLSVESVIEMALVLFN